MQYSFRLNSLRLIAKREFERPDKLYLYFALKINDQTYVAQASGPPTTGFLWEIEAGREVLLYGRTGTEVPDQSWEIGPIEVGNDDVVTWSFLLANSWKGAEGDTAKWLSIVGGALLSAAGVPIAAGPGGFIVGGALAIVGGLVSLVGSLLPSKPDCDGLDAAELQTISGAGLAGLDYLNGPWETSRTTTITYSGSPSAGGCGNAKVDVTHTIATPYAFIDLGADPQLAPDIAGNVKAWTGTWADERLLEESTIVCRIDADVTLDIAAVHSRDLLSEKAHRTDPTPRAQLDAAVQDVVAASAHHKKPPVNGPLATLVSKIGARVSSGVDAFEHLGSDPLLGHLPPTVVRQDLLRFPSGNPAFIAPATSLPRYAVTAIEQDYARRSKTLAERQERMLVDLPMQTAPYHGPKYAAPAVWAQRFAEAHAQAAMPAHDSSRAWEQVATEIHRIDEHARAVPGITESSVVASSLSLAATIIVSTDLVLQLYGMYDASHHLVDHRIRYIRTSANGGLVTDVMLQPATTTPR